MSFLFSFIFLYIYIYIYLYQVNPPLSFQAVSVNQGTSTPFSPFWSVSLLPCECCNHLLWFKVLQKAWRGSTLEPSLYEANWEWARGCQGGRRTKKEQEDFRGARRNKEEWMSSPSKPSWGASWAILGSWGYLGAILAIWGHVEPSWGASWAILGPLAGILWRSWAIFGQLRWSWAIWGHSWAHLKNRFEVGRRSWRLFWSPKWTQNWSKIY